MRFLQALLRSGLWLVPNHQQMPRLSRGSSFKMSLPGWNSGSCWVWAQLISSKLPSFQKNPVWLNYLDCLPYFDQLLPRTVCKMWSRDLVGLQWVDGCRRWVAQVTKLLTTKGVHLRCKGLWSGCREQSFWMMQISWSISPCARN